VFVLADFYQVGTAGWRRQRGGRQAGRGVHCSPVASPGVCCRASSVGGVSLGPDVQFSFGGSCLPATWEHAPPTLHRCRVCHGATFAPFQSLLGFNHPPRTPACAPRDAALLMPSFVSVPAPAALSHCTAHSAACASLTWVETFTTSWLRRTS
jgi:hypothetical protein